MGDDTIIIRVVSEAGRNRIEIDPKATVQDLKDQISEKLGLDADSIKFYGDVKYKNQIN